jgi:hypothetical protein
MLKRSNYTTFPPMMTSSSFDFRVNLKNIFALEPLLKLAKFVVEQVIYQNVKKKLKKLSPPPAVIAPPKKGPKKRKFFQIRYFSHIKCTKICSRTFFAFKDIK